MKNNWLMTSKGVLLHGLFGIEKENVRVTPSGELALTPHPAIFGDKAKNPFITTDFSESQVEMITPPMKSIAEALDFIETLHDVVTEQIGDELLWPQSLPPILPDEDKIPVAQYETEDKELERYREAIGIIYGKQRQLISGIHFNASLSDEFFEKALASGIFGSTMHEVKEGVYLKIMRNFMRYRWIYVWMFGETPLAEENFYIQSLTTGERQPMKCGASISLRTGPLGYRNKEAFFLDFGSVSSYNQQVEALVNAGKLSHTKELYLPLRLKFLAKDHGAPSYIEIRLIDLDPLSKSGVSADSLYFAHVLMLYALLKDEETPFDAAAQDKANRMQDYVSCFGRCTERAFPKEVASQSSIYAEAKLLIKDIESLLSPYGILDNPTYQQAWNNVLSFIEDPAKRPGMLVYEGSKHGKFIEFNLNLAKAYKAQTLNEGYKFHGLETMELSTQLLLKAAVCRGVYFEILDREENFVRLYNNLHEEYVVQATKTSLDSYATVLIMENKVVTKKVLHRHHIRVPLGKEYQDLDTALADFECFRGKAVVVKPKSTNFGIGISILKENNDAEDFRTALEISLEHDKTVMIEEFIMGKEYRFFVLEDEVAGILHRVPANVKGDGFLTIRQLVEIKNQDPLRGKGYRTPLEKIALGREEALFLKQQGLTFESIIPCDEVVYLRENSNISTGGDSVDFTDEMHPSYKAIAIEAARAVDATITGADIMIQDITLPATADNYAIIEVNFNPAIHIHCYPYMGKNRRINFKLLNALGF